MREQLQAIDFAQVAITAAIDPAGRLHAVGGLWPKLLAASKEAAQLGLLRFIVVAADQADITPELLAPEAAPLRVLRAATLHDAIQQIYEQHGPREAVRRHERVQCARLDLLGRSVPIEMYYQVLPLLREVKRERLPRAAHAAHAAQNREAEGDVSFVLQDVDLLRWEEELQDERVAYEPTSLTEIFHQYRSLVTDAASDTPRFVVLGPPGSGKTALVQYLGWQAAIGALHLPGRMLLPARVRLREWEAWAARDSTPESGLTAYLAYQYKALVPTPEVTHWRQWLQRGEVLLLLDGLDEIEGKPSFLSLVKTTLSAFAQCPAILTCRTVSFEQQKTVCPDFPLFTLAGFDSAQRRAYVRLFPAEHVADYNAEVLGERLDNASQLLPLAANPLLLSVMCYVADGEKDGLSLSTRGALYTKALEKLLLSRSRRIPVRYPGEEPSVDEKLAFVQQAALHLFVHQDRKLIFTGQEFGDALQQALSENGYGATAAPWANALRIDLTQNSGILRHHAEQGFFFLHLTVHEFLAARALARLINQWGWETPLVIADQQMTVRALIDHKAWDPRWREIIIFLAGQLRDARPLLQLLTDRKRDDFFRHRLALSAPCLSESMERSSEHTALRDLIVSAVVTQWEQYRRDNTNAAVPHLTQALSALGQVNGQIDRLSLWQWVQQRLRAASTEDARAGVVDLLGRLGAPIVQSAESVAVLVAALEDPAAAIRAEAVMSCHRIGAAAFQQLDVRRALENVAQTDPDAFVRSRAAMVLVGQHDHSSLMLPGRPSPAQPTASQSPTLSTPTIADLLSALSHTDRSTRAQAAHALSKRGVVVIQHPEAMTMLLQTALHDADGGVRSQATAAFGQLGPEVTRHPHALPALAAILRDRDGGVRAQAAKTLGQIGAPSLAHPYVLSDLLSALRDEDSYVRFRAAEALGRMMAQGVRIFRRWWVRWESKTVEELARVKR